jgi:hypothetical protein
MRDAWPRLLLFVFATHLPFFAWRYRRTGEVRFAATALTFALLTLTYALRVFAPGLELAGAPLWRLARIPAWASAAVSLALLARHHAARLRRAAP